MNRYDSFVLGIAAGAAATWLMDPDRGRRRRALVRDQLVHAGHVLDDSARTNARHLRNRAVGLVHEAKGELLDHAVDDRVLEERVRSAVGRKVSNASSLIVTADQGNVVLSGEVPSDEVQELVRAARSVRGVQHVENVLRVYTDPSGRPGLQGSSRG
jgi:osmotically-inducible protein OsmY